MHLDHISYSEFPNSGKERQSYIRGRRYLPGKNELKGHEVKPDFFPENLIASGVKHHTTVVKNERNRFMRMENAKDVYYCHLVNQGLPVIREGRIGLRHMFTRSSRYENFWVSTPGRVETVAPR